MINRQGCKSMIENYIIKVYGGKKVELDEDDFRTLKLNVLTQFYRHFLKEDEIVYDANSQVDILRVRDVCEQKLDKDFSLDVGAYEILLPTGQVMLVEMEFTTGYMMLSADECNTEDSKRMDEIYSELIILQGITKEDIEEKNMFYYHYVAEIEKRVL